MLLYVKQDIFESPAQVIVNTVNTVGVMGKGIAKKYKQLYPDMYKQYRHYCEQGLLDIGKLWLYKDEKKWVLNFPTKKHWRNPSEIEYIEKGLAKFVSTYEEKGIYSISFPQLGTGNGGLDWETEVKPLMEKYLKNLPIDVFVHIVDGFETFTEHKNIKETRKWLRKQPSALSAEFVWEDLLHIVTHADLKIFGWSVDSLVGDEKEESKLLIHTRDDNIEFNKEDFFDLWIKLRDFGYVFSRDLPENYREKNRSTNILRFLTLLPYIEPIKSINHQKQITTGVAVKKINLPDEEQSVSSQEQTELIFG
ncbi:O-acetyl-ADP-ribose deacetylase (regulator of RNase III), contains Macro domain [Alkalibacterium subtropicum]|uniref:O-acetyl-ADP-ribose deacetylase (Regulator of RNase III), contains Macro domain n=1 Tax=Alkalibacterium subtropicum TaxID=753702 RepID=A0A1I1GKB4_9LACT|nr:macro domain-containing protein [Alkalibacterium subtropicum]SFC10318.1 O-acetyl-ADP-ribose deacetylase (regulator of RNase III), contains Macro domain [Alkalibacterium subtropicum]